MTESHLESSRSKVLTSAAGTSHSRAHIVSAVRIQRRPLKMKPDLAFGECSGSAPLAAVEKTAAQRGHHVLMVRMANSSLLEALRLGHISLYLASLHCTSLHFTSLHFA